MYGIGGRGGDVPDEGERPHGFWRFQRFRGGDEIGPELDEVVVSVAYSSVNRMQLMRGTDLSAKTTESVARSALTFRMKCGPGFLNARSSLWV